MVLIIGMSVPIGVKTIVRVRIIGIIVVYEGMKIVVFWIEGSTVSVIVVVRAC